MSVLMPIKNKTAAVLFKNNLEGDSGHYLIGANRHWHGGMHFNMKGEVQAIADGKLIAFRLAKDYHEAELRFTDHNKQNQYSNSFALIQHSLTVKNRTLNYYSLYMHLQPASVYVKNSKQAIPDFIRVEATKPHDAIITTNEDKPRGLNIRDNKSGKVLITVPKGSIIQLDSSPIDTKKDERFLLNQKRNSDYQKVIFTDHKGQAYQGYSFLGTNQVKKEDNGYHVITIEDDDKRLSELNGVRQRSANNYKDNSNIVRVIPKNTKVKIIPQNSQWAKIIEVDREAQSSENYIYYQDNVKFDENDIDETLLDKIICPNQLISSGSLLGFPGKNFNQLNCLHFEIFSDDSIISFIEPHDSLEESDYTILEVKKDTKLYKRIHAPVEKADNATVSKFSFIQLENDSSVEGFKKISVLQQGFVAKRVDLGRFSNDSKQEYDGFKANLDVYKKEVPFLTSDNRPILIHLCDKSGKKLPDDSNTDYRMVIIDLPPEKVGTYWIKSEGYELYSPWKDQALKGHIIAEKYSELYKLYSFEESEADGSSDDAYIDRSNCEVCIDDEGQRWYKAELPFDENGIYHFIYHMMGENRNDIRKGWIKAKDTTLTSSLNWPGFRINKEKGQGGADSRINIKECSSFFSELLQDIDLNNNGKINPKEMKAALENDIIAERLGRVIANHPSEWQNDDQYSKWNHLKELLADDKALEEAKKQIKAMSWWDEASKSTTDLPKSSIVHSLNGLSLIEQINSMPLGILIGKNTFSRNVDVGTNWKKGFDRNMGDQNLYNEYLLEAGKKYPDIDLLVFKSLISQESDFKPKAHNNSGYAGLTQVGFSEWKKEAESSVGTSKKNKSTGDYYYDMEGDERFDPRKSIFGGLAVLKVTIDYIDKRFKLYNPNISLEEKYKFYMAGYNAGQGRMRNCLKIAYELKIKNPTWEDMITLPKESSVLWKAMPSSLDRAGKFKEITEYVELIMKRVSQK
jgi:hypothetical protein